MLRSLFTILIVLCSFYVQATTYYISPTGSDSAAGTTPSTAWRTINRVNATTFYPGDHILFQAWETHYGSIYLSPASHGTTADPIVIDIYDSGSSATIRSGNSYGIYAYNTAGITIKNLNIAGSGDSTNTTSGVVFYADTPGNVSLAGINIENVKVQGYGQQGISIGAWPRDGSRSGYRDIVIGHCDAVFNGDAGMALYGYYNTTDTSCTIKNVLIHNCNTFYNRGVAGATHNSGNGIVIGQVDSATIQYCESYNNGERNNYPSGPAGIWAWDSKHVIIEHCESHHNHSTTTDGDGFDLDGGTSYSIMQYNYSHDNDGAGFLVCQFAGARANTHNVVRYNISENDASKGNNGGIFIYTPTAADTLQYLDVYNNTIYTDTIGVNSRRAFYLVGPSVKHIRVANNIFMAKGNYLLDVRDTAGMLIVNNAYNDMGGKYHFLGTDYSSLSAFRTATGQEMLGSTPKGIVSNVLTQNPGHAGTSSYPPPAGNLSDSYFPVDTSRIVDSGLDLHALWGVDMGIMDILTLLVPWNSKYDIGACEYWYDVYVPQISTSNLCNIYPNPTTNKITIEAPVSSVHITLYNMFGIQVYDGITKNLKTELNLQAYPAGNYILQLSTKDWKENKKLVKY